MNTKPLQFVSTPHAPLHTFAAKADKDTAIAFKRDALSFAVENKHFAESPDLWVALGNDYRSDVIACKADTALKAVLAPTTINNYINKATRAVVALMVGNYTDAALKKMPFEALAEQGMTLLETSGNRDAFVAGYEPASRRKSALVEKGINPETGLTLSAKDKAAWLEKQAQHNAKAKAERAKKASDKAAKELLSHVAKDAPTIPHAQTHLIAESDAIGKIRARIDAAIAPKSKVTTAQMVKLLADIKDILPVPTMV